MHQIPTAEGVGQTITGILTDPGQGVGQIVAGIMISHGHRVGEMVTGISGSNGCRNPWVKGLPEWWVKGYRNIQYLKKFPLEFYILIYKLHGWPINDTNVYNRPGIVGKWTNEIIYQRFPNGILKALREKNPFMENGKRLHKHFQWLTLIGEVDLVQFIEDAIIVMRKSAYWDEFKRLYAIKFRLPYQGNLFEDK